MLAMKFTLTQHYFSGPRMLLDPNIVQGIAGGVGVGTLGLLFLRRLLRNDRAEVVVAATYQKVISDLNSRIDGQTAEIVSLKAEITNFNERFTQVFNRVSTLNAENIVLKAEVTKRDIIIEDLKRIAAGRRATDLPQIPPTAE